MKKHSLFLVFITLFTLSNCKSIDKVKEEIVAEYEEYGNTKEEEAEVKERGPKPFDDTIFQPYENAKTAIISAQCSNNQVPKYIHFGTQSEASHKIFTAIKNLYSYPQQGILKPYWDSRYTNPMGQYISSSTATHYPNHSQLTGLDARSGVRNVTVGTGLSQVDASASVIQSKCVEGKITAGTSLNLHDAPEQVLTYAGIQSTFTYYIHKNNDIFPWKKNITGNLLIQASFDEPIYNNFASNNIGASVSFNVFLYNSKIKKHLNYVIGVYASGVAWKKEKSGIRFDPTTNVVHVATVIKKTSWWSTMSPNSKSIKEIASKTINTKDDGKWDDLYRTNISYQNLLAVLNELKTNPPAAVAGQDFGLSPEDWKVTLLAVQYELEEKGGKALLSGSFRGFEVSISQLPVK